MYASSNAAPESAPQLRDLVDRRDGFREPLATIAGFSAALEDGGATIRATAVLLDADTLEARAREVVRLPAAARDATGHPACPELPALLAALAALPQPPDLVLVEGHGTAHPQGAGIAAAFGVATGLPTIGVAETVIAGSGPEPHQTRGAYTALRDGTRRQTGWLLRSRPGCAPLVVSPGHRVALASAADLVMRCVRDHRLPLPIRLAWQASLRAAAPDRREPGHDAPES